MIIQKVEKGFLVKIYKESLVDFDFLDRDSIQELFQKIFIKIRKRHELKGLLDVDVYVNDQFGLIVEIQEVNSYFDEVDMHIHFHIGSIFFIEIELDDIFKYKDVYYYQDKFYGMYQEVVDSSIVYKESEEIIEKGIKVC